MEQQPTPELVQDDVLDKDQEIQALKAQIALMEQALKAPDTQLEVEPEQSADDVVEASGFKMPPALAMGLQMIQTPEGRKALAGMVSQHLSKVDLQVRNDGVSVAVHTTNAVFRADAWIEEQSTSIEGIADNGKTIPMWGEGSLDYSDFF
jgi:hypothetical protein